MRTRSILPLFVVTLLLCACLVTAQAPGGPTEPKATPEAKGTAWTGKLVDSDCRANSPTAPCDVSVTTSNFGVLTSSEAFYKLDSKGNQMAKDKVKSAKKEGPIQVKVTGKIEGETIAVDTLSIS